MTRESVSHIGGTASANSRSLMAGGSAVLAKQASLVMPAPPPAPHTSMADLEPAHSFSAGGGGGKGRGSRRNSSARDHSDKERDKDRDRDKDKDSALKGSPKGGSDATVTRKKSLSRSGGSTARGEASMPTRRVSEAGVGDTVAQAIENVAARRAAEEAAQAAAQLAARNELAERHLERYFDSNMTAQAAFNGNFYRAALVVGFWFAGCSPDTAWQNRGLGFGFLAAGLAAAFALTWGPGLVASNPPWRQPDGYLRRWVPEWCALSGRRDGTRTSNGLTDGRTPPHTHGPLPLPVSPPSHPS